MNKKTTLTEVRTTISEALQEQHKKASETQKNKEYPVTSIVTMRNNIICIGFHQYETGVSESFELSDLCTDLNYHTFLNELDAELELMEIELEDRLEKYDIAQEIKKQISENIETMNAEVRRNKVDILKPVEKELRKEEYLDDYASYQEELSKRIKKED